MKRGSRRGWLQVQHQHIEGFDGLLYLLLGGCPWELWESGCGALCWQLGARLAAGKTLQWGSLLLAGRWVGLLLLLP